MCRRIVYKAVTLRVEPDTKIADQSIKNAEPTFAAQPEILKGEIGVFESSFIEFEDSIRKSLKTFKKDLIIWYGVLTVFELLIFYFILRLLS